MRTDLVSGYLAVGCTAACVICQQSGIEAPALTTAVEASFGCWFAAAATSRTDMSRRPDRRRSAEIEQAKANQRRVDRGEPVIDNIERGKPPGHQPPPVDDGLCRHIAPDNVLDCQLASDHVGLHINDTSRWYGNVWFDDEHINQPVQLSPHDAQRLSRTSNIWASVSSKGN